MVGLPGLDGAVGVRSARIHRGIDPGIPSPGLGPAINVVAHKSGNAVPAEIHGVLRRCRSGTGQALRSSVRGVARERTGRRSAA